MFCMPPGWLFISVLSLSVEGVESILYLSSFGYYQITATSPEALTDIIIAVSQQEGEALWQF